MKGGMAVKSKAVLRALEGGVEAVHVVDGREPHSVVVELFTEKGVGIPGDGVASSRRMPAVGPLPAKGEVLYPGDDSRVLSTYPVEGSLRKGEGQCDGLGGPFGISTLPHMSW